MSDKLSPKPTNKKLYNWQELDDFLQMMFSSGSTKSINIIPSDYEMSKEEIVSELKKKNYSVEEKEDYLKVS